MDQKAGEYLRERMKRPMRNKRYSRRNYGEERRPPKRLFTPEIKRFLKDWLVRRRDNPYPNRDEKKMLAVQTGLTYIQVCNWFANWRRKLKNAGKNPQRKTWGELIKTYNNQVQGNVEHFSICSDDSIWEEVEENYDNNRYHYQKYDEDELLKNRYNNNNDSDCKNQCYFLNPTTNLFGQSNIKNKNEVIEKYLKSSTTPNPIIENTKQPTSMIEKWLQSAERFKPSENNFIEWTFSKIQKKKSIKSNNDNNLTVLHGKEELDAAEALTFLANSNRK